MFRQRLHLSRQAWTRDWSFDVAGAVVDSCHEYLLGVVTVDYQRHKDLIFLTGDGRLCNTDWDPTGVTAVTTSRRPSPDGWIA